MRGIGTDIIEIERIRSALGRMHDSFLKYILTPREIEYSTKFKDPAPHIAGRFAAKEAIAKALGTGLGASLSFQDIEVLNNELGQPIVTLSSRTMEFFKSPQIHLSISHCKEHAIAFAISV